MEMKDLPEGYKRVFCLGRFDGIDYAMAANLMKEMANVLLMVSNLKVDQDPMALKKEVESAIDFSRLAVEKFKEWK